MNIFKVVLSNPAKQDLLKVPVHIVRKLQSWVNNVETNGLLEARKILGYHDELLKGKRVKIDTIE